MSPQFTTALIRGQIGAAITAGAVFFASLLQGAETDKAGIAAGAAAFSYLVVRFGAEGVIDTNKANSVPPAMG